ncbi:MAG: reverse transcriptase domain-containing protein [Planctomycetota bacterium]
MKRAAGLYGAIAEHDNLLAAYHAARSGKQDRPAVLAFTQDLDRQIELLRRELLAEDVQLRGHRFFTIHDPKPRRIAAPAFRDRVLHHAIVQVIEADLDRVAVFDSYACRSGKGLYRATARTQAFCRRYSHYLQLDVRKYFDSIDHDVLRGLLVRRFKDQPLLRLLSQIISSYWTVPGKGLPIGALTSQHFANFYLAPLDHFVPEDLRVGGYVLYMDDFVSFGRDRSVLQAWRGEVPDFLAQELRLQLKNEGVLERTAAGVGYLGMLVRGSHVRLLGRTKRRVRRKFQELVARHATGALGDEELAVRTTALLARTHHMKAFGLRRRWIAEFGDVDA